jgi:hypothetical protein
VVGSSSLPPQPVSAVTDNVSANNNENAFVIWVFLKNAIVKFLLFSLEWLY